MKTVRLAANVIVEIIPDYALPVEKWYGEEFAKQCMTCGDEVEYGWYYDPETDTFSATKANAIPEAQSNKISDCSSCCQQHIYEGVDVTLLDGTVQHFSYDLADQANVSEMFYAVLSGATEYPYHADDEICRVYSKEDIVRIYSTLSMYKTELVTYFNNLKAQIMQMDDVDEINAVEFLVTRLEGEFLENYNNMIATAKAQLETILSNIKTNG